MSEVEIVAKDVSIEFQLKKPSFFDFVKRGGRPDVDSTFRAINNISFKIQAGDRVGVIGKNGAGKSTLLKLISGVLEPNMGKLSINGSVFPLLDLSADIISQASCLQNIRLSGLLNGLRGDEMNAYIETVRRSADIEPFIYSPVSTLSTGMKTRFLVSLIGDVKPEILIMDEWIGTADRGFTDRKTSKFNKLVDAADIFVLATHNRKLIRGLCNKIMLIDQGELIYFGEISEGYKLFNASTGT